MTALAPRRAFLRGLISLPLVGGAVELIGNPRAVACVPTNQLMHEYIDWLGWERQGAIREMYAGDVAKLKQQFGPVVPIRPDEGDRYLRRKEGMFSLCSHAFQWHHAAPAPQPSTRAALVLAAVGCDWRGPYL